MIDAEAVRALSALANEQRLRIFRTLVNAGPSGLRAGLLGAHLDISPTSLSFHLKELDRAGLLVATRRGRNIIYAVEIDGVRRLVTFLTEDCCRGRPELCGSALTSARMCDEASDHTDTRVRDD